MNIHPLLCFRADFRAISLGNSLLTMSINAYFWHVSESKMAIIQNDDWNVLRFPLKVYKDIWFEVFDGKKCTFMCSKNFFFPQQMCCIKEEIVRSFLYAAMLQHRAYLFDVMVWSFMGWYFQTLNKYFVNRI